jgi:hypothetical protein
MKNDTELYHYGVKGMKWGKRKYKKRFGEKTSSKDPNELNPKPGIDTDYTNTNPEYWHPDTGDIFGVTYENTYNQSGNSSGKTGVSKTPVAKGKAFVSAMANTSKKARTISRVTHNIAVAIINSNASTPIRLLGAIAAESVSKLTGKIANASATAALNSSMKKK